MVVIGFLIEVDVTRRNLSLVNRRYLVILDTVSTHIYFMKVRSNISLSCHNLRRTSSTLIGRRSYSQPLTDF